MTAAEPARRIRPTPRRVRHLSTDDLGLTVRSPSSSRNAPSVNSSEPAPVEELLPLDQDHPILATSLELLEKYGGIIFVGPPGTSKSYYASRLAFTLVDGDRSRMRLVQFHPSYQYEDFMEGFVPLVGGGFELRDKHFLQLCKMPADKRVVLVIDELSRGDPGRVFGEALTYIERTKRNIKFRLASGTECLVPPNLVVLATMNPLDRGVDEVDAALERRFAKIALEPDSEMLAILLAEAGMSDDLRVRVLRFFESVNRRSAANPHVAVGHTYFAGLRSEDDLHQLWEHQLRFHFDKAYRLDADGLAEVYRLWDTMLDLGPSTSMEAVAEDTTAFPSDRV